MDVDEIAQRLRRRILARLHAGGLEAGDRLPSIRSLAADLDRDHRAVAEAYRLLENEGLVDIRPRSGVFVAERQRLGEGRILSPTARWVADVLLQGLTRQIPVADLPSVITQCSTALDLVCLCIESAEDGLDAIAHEVEREVGLSVRPFLISDPPTDREIEDVRDALRGADVLVTTVFASPALRPLAREAGAPVVEVQINAEWTATFRKALRKGPVTVVVKDPRFEERLRATAGVEGREDFRVVPVDRAEIGETGESPTVYLTPAARRCLARSGATELSRRSGGNGSDGGSERSAGSGRSQVPGPDGSRASRSGRVDEGDGGPDGFGRADELSNAPMLSPETLRDLVRIMVQRNVESGRCPEKDEGAAAAGMGAR